MENPKVSVIIPVYNTEKYLRTCLNSIVNQTLDDIEIICVNDGSTDSSGEILDAYKVHDDRIRIVMQENGGLGSARNTGLRHATGQYVTFVDSDDYVEWDMCERTFNIAKSVDADIVVYGGITFPTEKWADNALTTNCCEYHDDSINALLHEKGSKPFAWNKLYKRSLIIDNELFFPDRLFGEDQAWAFLVFPKAENIIYISDRFYHYRQGRTDSLMAIYGADKGVKLEQHKKIVEFVYDKWNENGYFVKYGQHWAYWCLNFFGKDVIRTSYVQARNLSKWIIERANPFRDCLDKDTQDILDKLNDMFPEYTEIEPVSPAVSVIVPVYNARKYLPQCLESILKQTFTNFELICIDDGSTDGSLQILYKYADIDKRIKILTQSNQYAGVARNKGMAVAQGEYYLFLDSDDFFERDMLEKAYGQIKKYEADICVFGSDIFDEALQQFKSSPWTCSKDRTPQGEIFSRKTNNKNIYWFTTPAPWTKLFKRSFIEKYNLRFQEVRSANDMLFVLLALSLAEKIIAFPEIFIHYRQNGGSSLQSSQEKDPLAFYDAVLGLREALIQHGIYEDVEVPFKNFALDCCFYNLHTLHKPEAFEFLYYFLRDKALNELDIDKQTAEYWYAYPGNRIFQKREDIKTLTPVEYAKKYNLTIFMQPKVSIIMPSLNVADYIRESLESAINQTLKEIEIICVDAGSTDGTLDIIKSFADKDARVKLINSPMKSYGYQMNLGISMACGEYIGIIETDDYVKPEMYKELYNIAEEQQVDFVKADFYRFTTEKGNIKLNYNKLGNDSYYARVINPAVEQKVFRLLMNTWSGIYKRSFLEANNIKHNETQGAAYQDNGFWFETFCCARKVYFVGKAYYMNRRDNPNSSVYNPNWIPRMLVEYEYIYNWLEERNLLETFKGPFTRAKYANLMAGFDRAPYEKKWEYSNIFSREMGKHINKGEYGKEFFTNSDWEWLQTLINAPEDFCIKRIHYLIDNKENQIKLFAKRLHDTENRLKQVGKKLKGTEKKLNDCKRREKSLKGSISFRVGRIITWGPRKIRGGIRCYEQHGATYTTKRFLWHITHFK